MVRDEFTDDTVLRWSSKKENIAVEIEEHISDPYPSGTVVESLYTYTIREAGTERVERDRHISGLFSIAVWTRLLEESGFEIERQVPVALTHHLIDLHSIEYWLKLMQASVSTTVG